MTGARRVRVGLAQILVEGGRPDDNMHRAIQAVHAARREGCEIVVLPECLDLGWADESATTLAQPLDGPRSRALAAAARDAEVHVAAGLVERDGSELYNSALLIGPDGRRLLHHRKINEITRAAHVYTVGDRLGVADTPLGRVSMSICADNLSDSLAIGHVLARMSARLILSPSCWVVRPDHDNAATPYGEEWRRPYSELAHLYGVATVGVSSVGVLASGPLAGRRAIGCSLAMNSDGEIALQAPYGVDAAGLFVADLDVVEATTSGEPLLRSLRARGYRGP